MLASSLRLELRRRLLICRVLASIARYIADPISALLLTAPSVSALTLLAYNSGAMTAGDRLALVMNVLLAVATVYAVTLAAMTSLRTINNILHYYATCVEYSRVERRVANWCVTTAITATLSNRCKDVCGLVERLYSGRRDALAEILDVVRGVFGDDTKCLVDEEAVRRAAIRACPFCVMASSSGKQ